MKTLSRMLGAAAAVALLAACPASLDDRCAEGACDARESPDGGPPTAKEPEGCVYGLGPSESPACVVDAYAVFVSPTGNNAAAGTKAAPLQTIDAAVGKATAEGKPHIYVCTGAYKASVTITRKTSLFGIACDFATPAGSDKPRWTGASPAFVASIVGVQPRVVLADLDLTALDADPQVDGQSSIGVIVSDSTDVQLRSVTVTAGRASAGKNAGDKADVPAAPKGNAAPDGTSSGGGEGAKNVCSDGESKGGHGAGTGGLPAATAGLPAMPSGGAAGSPAVSCTSTAMGQTGAEGSVGDDAPKPTALGSLASAGWKPAAGGKGLNGARAQGGGGGSYVGGGGGGGGAGGCGGEGGDGGGGGGASVALVAVASSVTLSSSKLTSGAAGNGGSGAAGQVGQPGGGGGGGGRVTVGTDGCSGGTGGKGGDGGAGAGGAAGIAPAILFRGAQILKEASSLASGTPATAGLGGKPGTNDGLPAPTGEQLEISN
jgi:hypothetical protein